MKNKYHIAIISPEFPRYSNWGGVATFNYNLANRLSKQGHDVDVITLGISGKEDKSDIINSIKLKYVPFKTKNKLINQLYYRPPMSFVRYLGKKFFPLTSFIMKWNFFSFIKFIELNTIHQYDYIHTTIYHTPALLLSLILNKKIILHQQGPQESLNLYEHVTRDKKIKTFLEKMYTRYCSKLILCCSDYETNNTIKQYPKLKQIVKYYPNFIVSRDYENSLPLNVNHIVFFGRLEYRKGIDQVIKAFIELAEEYSDIQLHLIGEKGGGFPLEHQVSNFEKFWSSLKIRDDILRRIFFYPRIDDKKSLIRLLSGLKGIALLPSRYEPFGFVYIESMALGYITIVGRKGGGSEIINSGQNGFTVECQSREIKNLIATILSKPIKSNLQISQNAINTVRECYDIDSVCIPIYSNT